MQSHSSMDPERSQCWQDGAAAHTRRYQRDVECWLLDAKTVVPSERVQE